jgi:NADPH-dependent glutamate synthase beta subunit-like oxidoreductase
MPAQPFEADEALSEGVKIKWLSTITDIGEGALTVETMRLDDNGRPQPTGEFETLSADSVVLALGQQTDCGFLRKAPGVAFTEDDLVIVDSQLMTGRPGIFAGGDMAPGPRSVTVAVGQGKKAARAIDAFLRNEKAQHLPKHPVATFDLLHLPIYADAPPSLQSELPLAERLADGFAETMAGLSEKEAHYEAQRCLSCGNCYECDQCYAACPEDAIIKLGPGRRYLFDYALCTGCAVCFEQCPCHAIGMFPEPLATEHSV